MFTGLIQEIGVIRSIKRHQKSITLEVMSSFPQLELGESISTHGVCLTVTKFFEGTFFADVSIETLNQTILGNIKTGEHVHLERALLAGDRLGGHYLTGHVDGTGRFVQKRSLGQSEQFTFEVPERLAPFIAPKGSISINGVSLTVNGVNQCQFDVMLVPFTQTKTTFSALKSGSQVNVEVDIIAKYVASLSGKPGVDGHKLQDSGMTAEVLRRHGYM